LIPGNPAVMIQCHWAEIQASGFAPPNTNESAIIVVRPVANTAAIVRGKNNTTGNALVEAYILPP